MDKGTVIGMAAGACLLGLAGWAGLRRRSARRQTPDIYQRAWDMKTEVADELAVMAKKAGQSMLSLGKRLERYAG